MRVVVVGAGTGGCTFAGRLAQDGRHEVVLVEAGLDFGPFDDHNWPFELLDSRRIPTSHDWGLVNQDPTSPRVYALARAKVMGGCSSHNGCAAVRGLRGDFERWSRLGGVDFWNPDDFLEDFAAIDAGLRVRTYGDGEISPYQQAFYEAARAAGFPHSADINDIDEGVGASICPVNKRGGVRWNAAFGFVDPVRGRPNFRVVDQFEATELVLHSNRVTAVRGLRQGQPAEIEGDLFVLGAGAYGTPMLLLRSGIGDPETLATAGLEPHHDLPGVGRNLQDHPSVVLEYRARPELVARTEAHEKVRLAYDEGTILKARSPASRNLFDLHIFTVGGRTPDLVGWYWQVYVALLAPRSRGEIRPFRDEGRLRFAIEHRHVTDLEAADLEAIAWGVGETRRVAAETVFASVAEEIKPGPSTGGGELRRWIRDDHQHYYHPASSCPIGRDPREGAVVDAYGRVHGLEGLMIADASIMPHVTSANTNLPTAALAHRLARHFDVILGAPQVDLGDARIGAGPRRP